MRLYIRPEAPNAVKVLVFLAERGIEVETVDVATLSDEAFARASPLRQVPALDTGTGLTITESLTICQYLDALADRPSLFGDTVEARTRVAMWERRAELMLFDVCIEYGHHTQPIFAGRLAQFPDWAKAHAAKAAPMLALMETQLGAEPFLAGPSFSMADITAFLGIGGLALWGALPAPPGPAVARWMAELGARPSMAPLQALADQFRPRPAHEAG
ncbi:MAG: glutathione S-transferase family protein [Alphaproteobacteria bacterium]|nr:glutathione S-transferase family protein [Alphaproteobacteria bacterium]